MDRRNRIGRAQDQGEFPARAMTAPPPRSNEVRRTALPDDFSGIRFEVGRMAKFVAEARGDAVVIDCARLAASHWAKMVEEMSARAGNPVSAHESKAIALEGIDIWCRAHFFYQNDGANVEVIQTPRRMVKMTKVSKDVLRHFIEPFYRAFEEADSSFQRQSYDPDPIFVGDCIPYSQNVIVHCPSDRRYRVLPAGDLKKSWRHYQVVSYNETQGEEGMEFRHITRFLDKGVLPVYRVKLSNGTAFRCTGEHKVYAFQRRQRYRGGSYFVLETKTVKELIEARAGSKPDRWTYPVAVRIPEGRVRGKHIPKLANEQLWTEGLYVAEGWSETSAKGLLGGSSLGRPRARRATFRAKIGMNNTHAINTLKNNLDVLGQPYGEHVRKDGLVTIRMNASPFTTRLGFSFGRGSSKKRFPAWYTSLPKDKLSILLGAYALGDGYVPTRGQWKESAHLIYNTQSETLARQVAFMHLVLGRPVSFYEQPPWKEKKKIYRLYEYKKGAREKRPDLGSTRIVSIERDGEERCCDITVAENHNFLLEGGILVHNCDEAASIVCAMAAAIDITPVSFRFGGTGDTLHHVWARVYADGEWYDSDVTEPGFQLGDAAPFDHYESYEIPL